MGNGNEQRFAVRLCWKAAATDSDVTRDEVEFQGVQAGLRAQRVAARSTGGPRTRTACWLGELPRELVRQGGGGFQVVWHVRQCTDKECSAWSEWAAVAVACGKGDLNGDCIGDVVLGVGNNDGAAPGGMVLVVYGRRAGAAARPSTVLKPSWCCPAYFFGSHVAFGEDLDGDGYGDLAVGQPWSKVAVSIYRGGPDGVEERPSWEIEQPDRVGSCGSDLALVPGGPGGRAGLVVACRGAGPRGTSGGRSYYYPAASFGRAGDPPAPAWVGRVGGGPVGFSDLVAATGAGADGSPAGWVASSMVRPGGSSATDEFAIWVLRAGSAGVVSAALDEVRLRGGDWRPCSLLNLSAGTDVDGDGWADIVAGVHRGWGDHPADDAVVVFSGGEGPFRQAARAFQRSSFDDSELGLGGRVVTAGDGNGDLVGEVVAGAWDRRSARTGRVGLWRVSVMAEGPEAKLAERDDVLWWDVGTACDFDADGVDEAVVAVLLAGDRTASAEFLLVPLDGSATPLGGLDVPEELELMRPRPNFGVAVGSVGACW